jgi:hypothetical protein
LIPTLQLGQTGRRYGQAFPEATTLRAALVSFWEFEDNNAGSTFTDSHGANHLTLREGSGSFSTTTGSTGGGGTVVNRAFGPTIDNWTSYIPRSNTALDLPNSDWTVFVWSIGVRAQSDAAAMIFARMGSGGGGSAHVANIQSRATDGLFVGTLFDNASASVQPVSSIAASSTHWSALALTLDRTNNNVILRVWQNGSSDKDTSSFPNPQYTAASNANFCFDDWLYGDSTYQASALRHINSGKFDQACFVAKAITDNEFTYLVNSGAGKSYAQLLAESGN